MGTWQNAPGSFLSLLYLSGGAGSYLAPLRVAFHAHGEEGPGVHDRQEGFAHQFYTSKAWRKCARGYRAHCAHLCERCLAKGLIVPGVEVHHKIRLTPQNISDPAIALNWENLELLCKSCHDEERERRAKRWKIGPDGRVLL